MGGNPWNQWGGQGGYNNMAMNPMMGMGDNSSGDLGPNAEALPLGGRVSILPLFSN